jgi:hypothetical protein
MLLKIIENNHTTSQIFKMNGRFDNVDLNVFLFLPQMDKLIADVDPRPEVMPR